MTDTRIRYAPFDSVQLEDFGDMVAVVEYEDGSSKTVGIDSFEEGGAMIQSAMEWDTSIVQGYTAQRAPAPAPEDVGTPPIDRLEWQEEDFSFMGDEPSDWTPIQRNPTQPTSLDV